MSGIFEYHPRVDGEFDPIAAVTLCIESGAGSLLLDRSSMPAAFFDLSTGVAGALVQRLTNYGIRMAAVVPDRASHSRAFQQFAAEADHGSLFRFFATREQAIRWLEGDAASAGPLHDGPAAGRA